MTHGPDEVDTGESSRGFPLIDAQADLPVLVESPVMRSVFRLAHRIAVTNAPVLIFGETGTGKEVLAQFIHQASGRPAAALKSINCAALPPQLIVSTLFGHERGAFTGAVRRTAGVFEQAQGGTVFLDEVGELQAEAQAALLRVLETRRVTRVGSEREIQIDARVIAATHRNLERMVADGSFRQDLLYRLNTVVLEVPPLRERRDEILALARLFLRHVAVRWRCEVRDFHPVTAELLLAYAWPGNVRELRNSIERGALICEGRSIEPQHLPPAIRNESTAEAATSEQHPPAAAVGDDTAAQLNLRDALRRYEFELIQLALSRTGGNQRQAAKLLEIPRRTLVRKLRELRSSAS